MEGPSNREPSSFWSHFFDSYVVVVLSLQGDSPQNDEDEAELRASLSALQNEITALRERLAQALAERRKAIANEIASFHAPPLSSNDHVKEIEMAVSDLRKNRVAIDRGTEVLHA